jgi:hypothetical protein
MIPALAAFNIVAHSKQELVVCLEIASRRDIASLCERGDCDVRMKLGAIPCEVTCG